MTEQNKPSRSISIKDVNVRRTDGQFLAEMKFGRKDTTETVWRSDKFQNCNDALNWVIDKFASEDQAEMERRLPINSVLLRTAGGKWIRSHIRGDAEYALNYVNCARDLKHDVWRTTFVFGNAAGIDFVCSGKLASAKDIGTIVSDEIFSDMVRQDWLDDVDRMFNRYFLRDGMEFKKRSIEIGDTVAFNFNCCAVNSDFWRCCVSVSGREQFDLYESNGGFANIVAKIASRLDQSGE